MPASLQHHRKTTGLFQHQQRRSEPPLQEVLLHLAQQPGDADKYRRAIGYLGLISIITHIGAVAAQPERPSAFTGGRASARQRAADERVHGNATADTAGPGAWAKRRMTGMRSLTSHGLSAPLTAKEALRYETTPSILSTTMPVLEQIAPQTQQNAARDKRQPSAHHRMRHAAHRARKHKTKPAATLARKPVLASAEVSAADIIRSSAAKPPSASAVQMPANSLMAPIMTPAANLMSVSGAHQQNLRDQRHTAYRPGRAWDQPVHPHSDLPPCEDLDGPPSRLPDASKPLFLLTDTDFDLPPCPSLTGPHGRQPDMQIPPFATSGKAAHYLPLHIESVVTTSTALSSCLFSQNKHICAVTKAGIFFFSGYLAHWLYQSVTAPSHGVPASPPPALDPPPGADLQSDRQNAPAMDPVPSVVTAPVSEAALSEVLTPVPEAALAAVKTSGPEAALSEVLTPGPEAALAAVMIPAPQAPSMVVETPETKTAPASVALSQASTGAGSLSLTASGLPIPLFDGEAPALVSAIALATATPEPRDPAGSFTAIDMAHSSHLAHPAAPPWSEMLQHITLHYAHIQYENFIGDERWLAINHVQTRAMTEDFFTHYFDPLLYDIFSTVDRGQGISLPALLEHIHLRLAKETAEVSNLTALLNIGLMDGYRRQINQIRHTLAATFPAVLVSHATTPTTAAGHATESPTGNAPAEPRFSSPAANEASFPLSRATNGLYADIDWHLERIISQPLHQALRAHFLQRHRATAAPLRLSLRFQALWTAACDLVNRAIADDDVQTYFMQHPSARDYLGRYTTSLYQTWVKDIDDSDDPLSAVAVEESPDFTMLFSPHSRQQDTKYRQSVTETLATLVIYEHLLPDMVRWQNGVNAAELTLSPALLDELMITLRALPAT